MRIAESRWEALRVILHHTVMENFVHGIGWLTREAYGCIRSGLCNSFAPAEGVRSLAKQDIFQYPFKNIGRLDSISRMTAYAVALALKDAEMEYASARKQEIGIIGTSSGGSLTSDVEYFKDYIQGGRTLSRANLFIYTLPSSPLGEAAIHFGFMGPLLYTASQGNSLTTVMDMSAEILATQEATLMLAGQAEDGEALYFVIGPNQSEKTLCELSMVRPIVEADKNITDMIRTLSHLKDGNDPL